MEAIEYKASFVRIHFPDPWPKKKHIKRRLISLSFLHLLNQKILEKGKIEIITDSIGISGEGWKAHKWRYSRASTGPGSVVTKDGVSFIGDAFGKEIGSAGAALDSASRAVSNLHLSILEPAFGRRPVQSSLTDW